MYKTTGLGGGCHWCTEAVFASLKGIYGVKQGWIAAKPPQDSFSEAVIVTYDPAVITLRDLIEIHLHTHASASDHSMRKKYRSAIYVFNDEDRESAQQAIKELQTGFEQSIITQVLFFSDFKPSLPEHLNYYYSGPEKPFCTLYINPKLKWLKEKFTRLADEEKIRL